jgi:hypothetical protein
MCPGCGRRIGGRGWWITTIAWGVITSAVISFILTILLFGTTRLWMPIF